ncbi:MAG: putative TIM-barrel fold metal-dependent hydrolase [Actinomycetia bacterium]|nr:putative TIM-barrel fold metal-dependent hydrolase [Actinomycetes bacterium]
MTQYAHSMATLDYQAFDADNHYYEAIDAFTRHLDPKLGPRTVQWAEIDGRKYHVVGGRVSRAVVNPTFNPIAKAGAMHDYFRGNPEGRQPWEFLTEREPIPAEYRNHDARLARMDEFGLEAIWLFPTLGMLYEELLKDDPEAVTITFSAFNRWLEEDWGFAYQDRIFAAPYISLCDVEWAVRELDWALDHGARHVVMRPAAPLTAHGHRTASDTTFDPFWARVNEAGISVVVHAGDSGYSSNGYALDGFAAGFAGGTWRPNIKSFHIERAAFDFLITLSFDKLFERFPNLRIASVENGSEFLGELFKKLRSTDRKMPGYFATDAVASFREHVWINPFWEDDVYDTADLMGADRVIFGSDWPHIEGMPRPLDYVTELKEFDDDSRRKILRDNVRELNSPRR